MSDLLQDYLPLVVFIAVALAIGGNEADARAEAERLTAAGEDVWVSGVPAYSTLGYFDDPVLSTFVRWPETEVARMVFHELAHQLDRLVAGYAAGKAQHEVPVAQFAVVA